MNMRKMADKVQSKGRHGDSVLVHMHPAEVAGIASLTPGGLTINPETGKPEAFAFLLPMLAAWGGGAAASAMGYGALGVGLASAAGSMAGNAAIGSDTQTTLLSGLLAGIGGGMMAPTNAAVPAVEATQAVPSALNAGMAPVTTTPLGEFGSATADFYGGGLGNFGNAAPDALSAGAAGRAGQLGMDPSALNSYMANQAPPPLQPNNVPSLSGYYGANEAYPGGSMVGRPPPDEGLFGKAFGSEFQNTPTGESYWDTMSPGSKTMAAGAGLAAGASIADRIDRQQNKYSPPGKKAYDLPEQFPSDAENRGLIYNAAPQDYSHGFTDEWGFFHAARGGMVPPPRGYAEGGIASQAGIAGLPPQMPPQGMPPQGMPPQGPPQQGGDEQAKMQLIMATEAAVKGEVPPEQAQAIIKAFVAAFGQEALQMLVQKVSQEMQQGGQQGRTVQGPGTGTSDSVPAVVDGQEPVALSSGEYIVPEETVKKVGKPNLDALVQQTTGNAAVGAKPRREILPRAA